jgi:parallel beta-helix repeat protein
MIWDSSGNTVSKNNVDSSHMWGIRLLNSDENTITDNVISNHKNQQLESSILAGATALHITNSHDNTFSYNTISNNESPFNIRESTNNKIYNNNFLSNSNEGRRYTITTFSPIQMRVEFSHISWKMGPL